MKKQLLCKLQRALAPLRTFQQAITRQGWRLLGAAIAVIPTGSAQALLIDDFQVQQQAVAYNYQVNTVGSVVSPPELAPGLGILGGQREITTGIISGGFANVLGINTFGSGQLSHSARFSARTFSSVVYDGTDNDGITIKPDGLGGLDFLEMGLQAFCVNVLFSDHPSLLTVDVYDSRDPEGATRSTSSIVLPARIRTEQPFFLSFSSFQPAAGSPAAASFASVGAIAFRIEDTTEDSLDISFSRFEVLPVPEPSSVVFLGLACCGAATALSLRKRS